VLTRSHRRDNGQALVEFALVAPIFFLLLFGIIQGGLLFQAQNAIVSSVRETARYAAPYRVATSSDATTTCPTVLAKLTEALSQSMIAYNAANEVPAVTYTWNPDTNGDGMYHVTVKVVAAYKFPLWIPLVGNVIDGVDGVSDGKIRMSAQEEMRVENDALKDTYSSISC
jgi:Flp pilus assembly protein TadG